VRAQVMVSGGLAIAGGGCSAPELAVAVLPGGLGNDERRLESSIPVRMPTRVADLHRAGRIWRNEHAIHKHVFCSPDRLTRKQKMMSPAINSACCCMHMMMTVSYTPTQPLSIK